VAGNQPTAGQFLRRFTLGSGPLKRGSDRLEFLSRVLLVCCLLTVIPISLAVATATHARAQAEAVAQAADRHRVPALLLEDAAAPDGEATVGARRERAAAVWAGPAGIERRGVVSVPVGTRAGDSVRIWIDGRGDATGPPLGGSGVTARAVTEGLGTFLALSALAVAAHLSVRELLDRSRFRRWTAEWAAVEPVWTREVA
jgi:hypothetical protein